MAHRLRSGREGPSCIGRQCGFGDSDRALVTVIPHTTALRGSPFEIGVTAPFLKPGAFLVQGVASFPVTRALHRLGTLRPEQFDRVFAGLLRWLGRPPQSD